MIPQIDHLLFLLHESWSSHSNFELARKRLLRWVHQKEGLLPFTRNKMASSNLQIEEEEEQSFTSSQVYNLHKLLESGGFKQTKGKYKTQVWGRGGGMASDWNLKSR